MKPNIVDRLELAIQDDWYELCQEARAEILRLRDENDQLTKELAEKMIAVAFGIPENADS